MIEYGLKHLIAAGAVLLALSACSDEEANEQEALATAPLAEAGEAMPQEVSDAIRSHSTRDGEFLESSQGQFEILQETPFCEVPGGFGISPEALDQIFRALGQSRLHPSGRHRGGLPLGSYDDCKRPDAVVAAETQRRKGEGDGYVLMLVVWQGPRTFWAGSIERSDGIRPDVRKMPPPMSGDERERISGSLLRDSDELSAKFASHAMGRMNLRPPKRRRTRTPPQRPGCPQ